MEDRFKFRAWDEFGKYMIDDFHTKNTFQGVLTQDASYCEDSEDIYGCIVMACTGLKDVNGKLIFGGDILNVIKERHQEPLVLIDVIKSINGCWMFDGGLLCEYAGEIIGNIHENPELLETK